MQQVGLQSPRKTYNLTRYILSSSVSLLFLQRNVILGGGREPMNIVWTSIRSWIERDSYAILTLLLLKGAASAHPFELSTQRQKLLHTY